MRSSRSRALRAMQFMSSRCVAHSQAHTAESGAFDECVEGYLELETASGNA